MKMWVGKSRNRFLPVHVSTFLKYWILKFDLVTKKETHLGILSQGEERPAKSFARVIDSLEMDVEVKTAPVCLADS